MYKNFKLNQTHERVRNSEKIKTLLHSLILMELRDLRCSEPDLYLQAK